MGQGHDAGNHFIDSAWLVKIAERIHAYYDACAGVGSIGHLALDTASIAVPEAGHAGHCIARSR